MEHHYSATHMIRRACIVVSYPPVESEIICNPTFFSVMQGYVIELSPICLDLKQHAVAKCQAFIILPNELVL